MKYFTITFFVIIFSALGFLHLIKIGWYPVAIVNSKIIWGASLNKETKAAIYYFEQLLKANKKEGEVIEINQSEIKKAALENLIEKTLISKALRQETDGAEIDTRIKEVVDKHVNNPQLGPAAAFLYGLSLNDFYNMVLVAEAEKELFEKTLKERGVDLNDWLTKTKQSANIIYITKEF